MKVIFKKIWIALLVGVLMSSCEKAPEYGKIEGFWQLLVFTTEADKEVHTCNRIYYAIQLQVAEMSEKGGQKLPTLKGMFHYDEASNVVAIQDIYFYDKDKKEYATPNEALLNKYGLNNVDMELEVVKADGKVLILRSEYATLTLKRF